MDETHSNNLLKKQKTGHSLNVELNEFIKRDSYFKQPSELRQENIINNNLKAKDRKPSVFNFDQPISPNKDIINDYSQQEESVCESQNSRQQSENSQTNSTVNNGYSNYNEENEENEVYSYHNNHINHINNNVKKQQRSSYDSNKNAQSISNSSNSQRSNQNLSHSQSANNNSNSSTTQKKKKPKHLRTRFQENDINTIKTNNFSNYDNHKKTQILGDLGNNTDVFNDDANQENNLNIMETYNLKKKRTTFLGSEYSKTKKSEFFKSQFQDDESLDSVDIQELGLVYANSKSNTIKMKKKRYFKKIKKKNEKLRKQAELQERIKIISDFLINVISNTLNLCAVGVYIIQTIFEKSSNENPNNKEADDALDFLSSVEFLLSIYFLFEYFVFFFLAKSKIKFVISGDTIIDLITIIPPFITFFFEDVNIKFSLLRVFRIFRVFRILRIYKSIRRILNDSKDSTEDEGLLYNPVKLQVLQTVTVLICNFFIGAGLVLGLQEIIGDDAFSSDTMHFFDALYFVIITSTSIGYGDNFPKHPITRLFIIFGLFYLLIVVGNQLNKLAELMQIWGDGAVIYTNTNHVIIICDKSVCLRELLLEIKRLNEEQDIIIISMDIQKLPSIEYPYNKTILINTISIDFDVLLRANAGSSKCIFIITNKSLNDSNIKDKLSDFMILKITKYFKDCTIYTQSLFNEKLVNVGNSGIYDQITVANNSNLFNPNYQNFNLNVNPILPGTKKQIPIMKLKNFMLIKSTYNPGFLTFSQNLIFNDYTTPAEIHSIQPILKSYILGIENKIQIEMIPYFFVGKEYFDVVYNIYFRSIKDIFTKVRTRNINSNRPILLIGVVDLKKLNDPDNEDDPYEIFPSGLIIKNSMAGIFLCYKGTNYLKNFLSYFHKMRNEEEIINENDNSLDLEKNHYSEEFSEKRRKGQVYSQKEHDDKAPPSRRKTNAAIRVKFDRNQKMTKTMKVDSNLFNQRNKLHTKILKNISKKKREIKRFSYGVSKSSKEINNYYTDNIMIKGAKRMRNSNIDNIRKLFVHSTKNLYGTDSKASNTSHKRTSIDNTSKIVFSPTKANLKSFRKSETIDPSRLLNKASRPRINSVSSCNSEATGNNYFYNSRKNHDSEYTSGKSSYRSHTSRETERNRSKNVSDRTDKTDKTNKESNKSKNIFNIKLVKSDKNEPRRMSALNELCEFPLSDKNKVPNNTKTENLINNKKILQEEHNLEDIFTKDKEKMKTNKKFMRRFESIVEEPSQDSNSELKNNTESLNNNFNIKLEKVQSSDSKTEHKEKRESEKSVNTIANNSNISHTTNKIKNDIDNNDNNKKAEIQVENSNIKGVKKSINKSNFEKFEDIAKKQEQQKKEEDLENQNRKLSVENTNKNNLFLTPHKDPEAPKKKILSDKRRLKTKVSFQDPIANLSNDVLPRVNTNLNSQISFDSKEKDILRNDLNIDNVSRSKYSSPFYRQLSLQDTSFMNNGSINELQPTSNQLSSEISVSPIKRPKKSILKKNTNFENILGRQATTNLSQISENENEEEDYFGIRPSRKTFSESAYQATQRLSKYNMEADILLSQKQVNNEFRNRASKDSYAELKGSKIAGNINMSFFNNVDNLSENSHATSFLSESNLNSFNNNTNFKASLIQKQNTINKLNENNINIINNPNPSPVVVVDAIKDQQNKMNINLKLLEFKNISNQNLVTDNRKINRKIKHLKNRSSLAGLIIQEREEKENDNSFIQENNDERENEFQNTLKLEDNKISSINNIVSKVSTKNFISDNPFSEENTIKDSENRLLSINKEKDTDEDLEGYLKSFNKKAIFQNRQTTKKSTYKSKKSSIGMDDLEDGTKKNLEAISELEDNERFDVSKEVYLRCLEVFINNYDELEEINAEINTFYENRIISLDKVNVENIITDHIVIIGIQDSINKLVRLLNITFLEPKICIFVPNSMNAYSSSLFIKLLKTYKNLYIYVGESQNPYHLLKSGMNKAKLVLFLTQTLEDSTQEDMQNILSFKSIDYFFNVPFIIELWSKKSTKMIGYLPLDRSSNIIINEFLHPQFMAGRFLYHDCFDKLIGKCYNNEHEYEVWSRLVSLGFDNASNSYGFQPKINAKKKLGFPAIITFDLPDFYYEKDYHYLVGDLIALDEPVIPLGIYIEEPLLYINLKYEGGVSYDQGENNQIGITMSQKNKIKNISQMDVLEKKYYDSLNLLKDISYTDKIIMDVIDLERTYLPVFITNPPADFKLLSNIKVQVLCFFEPNKQKEDFKNKLYEVRKSKQSSLAFNESPTNKKNITNTEYVNKCEEKINIYLDILKKKCNNLSYEANKNCNKVIIKRHDKKNIDFGSRKNAI